ncbi:hypothetical protein AAV94_01245 [Lampropedia cohaerens]|uniref:CDP-6-deoxy-delta-3,4-glucoseen reductase n=1 Tax=Lampropedia cohaerens TaxID=1610491 RepID=A0A0U1Q2S6_9BURK|nr:translesion DNA synthesis-associated protein ImuA [Lampropedia cohaerens]KKW69062.1 hypothetical protein AAV94_01245 [Lampropedia cohaerens]
MAASLRSTTLQDLLHTRQVWQGHGVTTAPERGIPTGLPALDAALPQGGWPPAALTEILLPAIGCGELTLLLPTVARLSQDHQHVVLVAPPAVPFASAWRAQGVQLQYLHVLQADAEQALWAMEQCLRAGCCAAVLAWPHTASYAALRRLQVAADAGQCLGFVLRHANAGALQPSPAALRLAITATRQIEIRKCRGSVAPDVRFALQ